MSIEVLVLDGSRVLPALVSRVSPVEVHVVTVSSFGKALDRLRQNPPDALIVNLTPTDLPWKSLLQRCSSHRPPIPVIVESCICRTPEEAGISDAGGSLTFLVKPYPLAELRAQIERLVRHVDELRSERSPASGTG